MKSYFVTFGQYHPLRDFWIEIFAADEDHARRGVKHIFGIRL